MLRFMKAALILLILTTVTVMAQSPAVSVAVTPSTVIVMNEEITFTATARTANPNCTRVAFSYSLLSSPIPATGFPPVFGSSAQATTTVDRITVAGLYVFQLTVTDNCQTPPATTILPLNVRALGGTYDTAVVRVAVDAAGTFNWNGLAPSGVTGFMDGQTLTVSVPNVAPGDVFSIIGKNLPTATAPNPAMVAATIRWRDMDFNTSPTTWQCTNGNLTQTNGNNNWMMKPGNNPVLPAAVSQGTNAPGSVWAALNNINILGGVAPEAQFLWTQSTLNFPAADASVVSCRSVFTPPPEIVTGLVIVSSVPTVPPTLPPTLPPTTPPTIPPTTAVQPTTPPTVLPTTFAPTTATPVAGAGQNGAATTTAGGGTKLNPLFIVIPVVIVAAIIALIWIIRQRRKSLTPTPISKLSEMV